MKLLTARRGSLRLPAFLPDATRGVVRTIDAEDLEGCGIECLMVNTLHLSTEPGLGVIDSAGGIHRFMGWNGTLASDSGGYQIYSLLAGNPKSGSVSDDGFIYRLPGSPKKRILTPEKCIQIQWKLRSDIIFALDYCTHPSAPSRQQRHSVDLTVEWAKRCKAEFDSLIEGQQIETPPMLFAVVQGGGSLELRRECVERMLEIGFDGFGFGGWPIDARGKLFDMVGLVAEMLPPDSLKHALGVGKPESVLSAYYAGYDLFDCVLPTRDARKKRLYEFISTSALKGKIVDWNYRYLYMQDERHVRSELAIDESCDCLACRRYSRSYLHHLFKIGDPLGARLATIHNLRFYFRLFDLLRFHDN